MTAPVLRLRGSFDPLLPGFAEEERFQPPAMDLEAEDLRPVEPGEPGKPPWVRLPPEEKLPEDFRFCGFLDGVQRTVLAGVLRTQKGIRVPVYRARVMAGLLVRRDTTPRMGPVRAWDLLVAPFRAVGEDPAALAASLRDQGLPAWTGSGAFGASLDPKILSELLGPRPAWILADTSYRGLSEDPHSSLISTDDLMREREVRARAQGRVAHLRQVLELLLLLAIRLPEAGLLDTAEPAPLSPDAPILVDGPLLLSIRRRKWLADLLSRMGRPDAGEERLERRLLRNAVGLVKGHRLRPRDLVVVLQLPEGHRTEFYAFHREVEVHGRSLREDVEADEDHQYPSWHLTAYVRLRESRESHLAGLVRIDLLRPEPDRGTEPLSPEEKQDLDWWAASVYRERRPHLPGTREQPFPISLLERSLHARMPPPMALAGSLRLEGVG
jgi:hypothetical protein